MDWVEVSSRITSIVWMYVLENIYVDKGTIDILCVMI